MRASWFCSTTSPCSYPLATALLSKPLLRATQAHPCYRTTLKNWVAASKHHACGFWCCEMLLPWIGPVATPPKFGSVWCACLSERRVKAVMEKGFSLHGGHWGPCARPVCECRTRKEERSSKSVEVYGQSCSWKAKEGLEAWKASWEPLSFLWFSMVPGFLAWLPRGCSLAALARKDSALALSCLLESEWFLHPALLQEP